MSTRCSVTKHSGSVNYGRLIPLLAAWSPFRTHPGIMTYEKKPDYSRVVEIITWDFLHELVTPGLLAVMAPIVVGFALGYAPLGSDLAGAIAVGVLMALFLANSGGAWHNAEKLVEDGNHGGKGSEAHAATGVGDTLGDPFKDTADPAINPLINLMNLVSLLIATSVVKYLSDTGLRADAVINIGTADFGSSASRISTSEFGETCHEHLPRPLRQLWTRTLLAVLRVRSMRWWSSAAGSAALMYIRTGSGTT
jgi:hypothetical protein